MSETLLALIVFGVLFAITLLGLAIESRKSDRQGIPPMPRKTDPASRETGTSRMDR